MSAKNFNIRLTVVVIARVHPKVLGHNADMTYLLKINNLRNYVIGNAVKQSQKSIPMDCFRLYVRK
jgi:hypothetical protein